MLRCSGGQASHQVYQGQMYFDQGHKSSACAGDQVDFHVNGQVGVDNPIQLSDDDVFAQLDVLEVVEVVVVAFCGGPSGGDGVVGGGAVLGGGSVSTLPGL